VVRRCRRAGLAICGVCGNGAIEEGEECDATNLNGETCVTRGFAGGTLRCAADCRLDVSQCFATRFVDNGDGTWSWSQTGDESDSGTVTVTVTNPDPRPVSVLLRPATIGFVVALRLSTHVCWPCEVEATHFALACCGVFAIDPSFGRLSRKAACD